MNPTVLYNFFKFHYAFVCVFVLLPWGFWAVVGQSTCHGEEVHDMSWTTVCTTLNGWRIKCELLLGLKQACYSRGEVPDHPMCAVQQAFHCKGVCLSASSKIFCGTPRWATWLGASSLLPFLGGLSAALEPGALVADFVTPSERARPEALAAVITAWAVFAHLPWPPALSCSQTEAQALPPPASLFSVSHR